MTTIVEMLWRNGYIVQVSREGRVLWRRRAGRSRRLLRKYLEMAARVRKKMLAGATAALLLLAVLPGCGGTEADPPAPQTQIAPDPTLWYWSGSSWTCYSSRTIAYGCCPSTGPQPGDTVDPIGPRFQPDQPGVCPAPTR